MGCTDRVGCMTQQLSMLRCQKRGPGDQDVDERFARRSHPQNLGTPPPTTLLDKNPRSVPRFTSFCPSITSTDAMTWSR